MSTPVNGDSPKVQITCPKCSQVFSKDLPEGEISNNYKSSIVVVAHEKPIRCTNNKCLQAFVFVIQGVQTHFNVTPIDDTVAKKIEGSNIIVPQLKLM